MPARNALRRVGAVARRQHAGQHRDHQAMVAMPLRRLQHDAAACRGRSRPARGCRISASAKPGASPGQHACAAEMLPQRRRQTADRSAPPPRRNAAAAPRGRRPRYRPAPSAPPGRCRPAAPPPARPRSCCSATSADVLPGRQRAPTAPEQPGGQAVRAGRVPDALEVAEFARQRRPGSARPPARPAARPA